MDMFYNIHKNTIKVIIFSVMMLCLLCSCKPDLTDEELAEIRANSISEYEVVSVMKYTETRTNNFGGVTGTDICYAFEYIDDDGVLKSVKDFQHFEYGLTKVCIGDEDKYVVDEYGETRRYLYLTKDTLKSMSKK